MAQPLLSPCQTVPLKTVRTAEVTIVSGQDHRSPAAVTNQFSPYTPEELCISQFTRLVFPGDMAALHQTFPQGKRNLPETFLAQLRCRRLIHHIQCAVQPIYQQRLPFNDLVVFADQRQNNFIRTHSHSAMLPF